MKNTQSYLQQVSAARQEEGSCSQPAFSSSRACSPFQLCESLTQWLFDCRSAAGMLDLDYEKSPGQALRIMNLQISVYDWASLAWHSISASGGQECLPSIEVVTTMNLAFAWPREMPKWQSLQVAAFIASCCRDSLWHSAWLCRRYLRESVTQPRAVKELASVTRTNFSISVGAPICVSGHPLAPQ